MPSHAPTTRRADHEGSLRKRSGTWQGRIQLGGRTYTATGPTRAAAAASLRALAVQYDTGRLRTDLTVSDWLDKWLETGEWKATTRERYAQIVRLHLKPCLGGLRLGAVDAAAVKRQVSAVTTAPGTRLKVYRTLSAALSEAVINGFIPSNPCIQVAPPTVPRYLPRLWSPAETAHFVGRLESTGYGRLWALLLGTGCRLGEALALHWQDYDEQTGAVLIRATLAETRAGGLVRTTPKTPSAMRRVVLPAFARGLVDAATRPEADSPIVHTEHGRSPTRWLVHSAFGAACRRAGVPTVRVHDLRHLHASLLLAAGVPLSAVSSRLGHANPGVTASIYAHALLGADTVAVAALDAFGWGSD